MNKYVFKKIIGDELVPIADIVADEKSFKKLAKKLEMGKPTAQQLEVTKKWLATRWRTNDEGFRYLGINNFFVEVRGNQVVLFHKDGTNNHVCEVTPPKT